MCVWCKRNNSPNKSQRRAPSLNSQGRVDFDVSLEWAACPALASITLIYNKAAASRPFQGDVHTKDCNLLDHTPDEWCRFFRSNVVSNEPVKRTNVRVVVL